MKKCLETLLLPLFVVRIFSLNGQDLPANVCRIGDSAIIFEINLKWSDDQFGQMEELFDLDSLLLDQVRQGITGEVPGYKPWHVRVAGENQVELFKSLTGEKGRNEEILMLDDRWMDRTPDSDCLGASYGINQFTVPWAFSYRESVARFFLPGHTEASGVLLSGTFNAWSTSRLPMTRCDSGWTATVTLRPCKYHYKYIVDGAWLTDPSNKLKENDTYGGSNSVIYCQNHVFSLDGYTGARKVVVAGSFNNWNRKELVMNRRDGGWELPVFLHEGTHAYKFIVDKEWILDPANKITRPDGSGNTNSFIGIGDTMFFYLAGFLNSSKVVVTGDFNGWNPGELFMTKTENGWELPYVLGPGNYEYKFITDGQWMSDPDNPFTLGSGDYTNSFLTVRPNYTFTLKGYGSAGKVYVAGSFNGWNPKGFRMVRKDDVWIFPLFLKKGKHTYKFTVDGDWILDPANELWEENEYGTGNSVLWME